MNEIKTDNHQDAAVEIFSNHSGADCEWCGALCPDDAAKLIDAIAADRRDLEARVRAEEREACVKIAESCYQDENWNTMYRTSAAVIAGRIRARALEQEKGE